MNAKAIKIIGTIATIGGVIFSLLGEWASGKEMEITVQEMVDKALAEKKG